MMNESFFSIQGVPESINNFEKSLCQNFHLFSSSKFFSNFMPYSCKVRNTWHALLYIKPNLSMWGFTMPKGFGIGQHIREIPGTFVLARTFGHTVGHRGPAGTSNKYLHNTGTSITQVQNPKSWTVNYPVDQELKEQKLTKKSKYFFAVAITNHIEWI